MDKKVIITEILKDAEITTYDYSVAGEGGASSGSLSGRSTLAFTFSDTRDLSLISYKVDSPIENIETQTSADIDTTMSTTSEEVIVNQAGISANNTNVVGDVRPDLPSEGTVSNNPQSQ